MIWTRQYHLYLVGIILAFGLAALAFLGYSAWSVINKNAAIAEIKKELAVVSAPDALSRSVPPNLGRIREAVDRIDYFAMISEKNQFEFVQFLVDAGGPRVAVKVDFGQRKERLPGAPGARVPIALDISGTFPDILRFLKNLETSDYYLFVQTIDLQRANDRVAEPLVKGAIRGYVYWL